MKQQNSPDVASPKLDGIRAIVSCCRAAGPAFDPQSEGGFCERSARLHAGGRVELVQQVVVRNAEELERFEADCVPAGFEGVMVRDPAAPYIEGRSRALQKLKRFEDSEAICTGMSEADRLEWYRHAVGQPLRFPVFSGLRDPRDL